MPPPVRKGGPLSPSPSSILHPPILSSTLRTPHPPGVTPHPAPRSPPRPPGLLFPGSGANPYNSQQTPRKEPPMQERIAYQGITFDDVLLEPAYSDVVPRDVDVRTRLTRSIWLNIP